MLPKNMLCKLLLLTGFFHRSRQHSKDKGNTLVIKVLSKPQTSGFCYSYRLISSSFFKSYIIIRPTFYLDFFFSSSSLSTIDLFSTFNSFRGLLSFGSFYALHVFAKSFSFSSPRLYSLPNTVLSDRLIAFAFALSFVVVVFNFRFSFNGREYSL